MPTSTLQAIIKNYFKNFKKSQIMKKLFKLSLFSLAFISLSVFAQDEEDRFDFDDSRQSTERKKKVDVDWHWNDDNDDRKPVNRNKNMFSKKDFGLVLGINSFDKAMDMPELNQWQSRYVALQWRKNTKLITGRHIDVALGSGLEFAWNNFMMKYDEQYFEDGNISDFELVDYELDKSKLVVNTLNLPVMLQFGFKESDFRLGVGAYGGVRINSYQKFKEFDNTKYKEKGDYNLNRWNYGLMAEAGKGDFRLFAKYDMQPMFNSNNPINANVFTVGVRL
jgi:hypothetical protein